jgi:Uma2 family endonuclease
MATAFDRSVIESSTRFFTAADLAVLPTELPSGTVDYELDNGRLVTMVPPGDIHGSVQANVVTELKIQGERKGHGKARSEVGIILWHDPDRVVGADAAFIANSSLPIERSSEGYLETKPDIVVEVKSKNDTDTYVQRKVDDYLTAGVKVVWVADPEKQSVVEHRRNAKPKRFEEGDALESEHIPEFILPVSDIFAV